MRCVILAVGLLPACTKHAPEPPPKPSTAEAEVPVRAEVGEIMLRKTTCYGECPAFTAFFHTDGRVFFHGRAYAERAGLHAGTVDPAEVQALFGVALDGGYFDSSNDYRRHITDNATVYTSMVVDGKRHWVKNYARAAPPEVAAVEEGADALLAKVTWDAAPARSPYATGCKGLGEAILARCDPVLTLQGKNPECAFWLDAWGSLNAGPKVGPEETVARCDRQLASLQLDSGETPLRKRPPELGPKCREWLDAVSACRTALAAGDVKADGCGGIHEEIETVLGSLSYDGDAKAREAMAEFQCGRYIKWR